MTTDEPATAAVEAEPTEPQRLPRWRRILVGVLVVLGCVLTPISIIGVWIHATLLDTDQWVETVGPLIDEPAVQEAVANRVTDAVISGSDLEERVRDLLPARAGPLAGAIAQGARQAVGVAALEIVESDTFSNLWRELNRRAHRRVVAVLQGEGTETVSTRNGQITLDLAPIVDDVKDALNDRGVTLFDDVSTRLPNRQIVIFSSEDLRSAQSIVDLLDKLAWVLPVVTVLCFALAIGLSGNRRRTVLRGALGAGLAVGLVLTAFNLGRTAYLDALPENVNRAAAQDVYDQLLMFLRNSLRATFVLAIIVALAAWISGPSRIAVRVRQTVGRGVDRTGDLGTAPVGVGAFVARYRNALRVLVIGLALVVLMALAHPGPGAVLVIAVLAVLALLVIEVLARGGEPTSGEAAPAGS